MKFEDRSQSYNRRRFLEHFAALGLASVIPAAGVKGAALESAGKITAETIAEAEKLIGIEFTPEERRRIAETISENLEAYQALRESGMDETVFPAMVFNPVPAGAVLPTERLPFAYSRPDVRRPASIEDAAYFSVVELAALIETRQVSSMDLTGMYLARLKRYDPKLRFVFNLTEDLALRQAKRADEEIASGKYRGPLQGIPYGIKDLFSVKGYPTTWGAEPFRDRIIDRDEGEMNSKQPNSGPEDTEIRLDFVAMMINHNCWIRPIQGRDKMKKKDLPDFPPLFEAIGKFLREAEVPQHQQKDLMAAQKGLDIIARTLYSRQAKVYPCTGGVPRISPMPLSRTTK